MIKSIKGTRDILPPESALWSRVENTAREIFDLYGFAEVRTPIFESTELFARGVGEDTDIVSKEMYTFPDRDNRSLTLRPEGTAPVVRAYIEHQLQQESPIAKLYYLGPMFRRERPQKGRYRQFHQIGAEVLGSDNPAIEAEVLEMLQFFLKQIGIEDQTLLVNSIGCPVCRPRFLEELKRALAEKKTRLCADCQRRSETNPLRVLDCKVESCQPIIESLPKISDFLDDACRVHFDKFLGYLTSREVSFTIVPRLVRGLDYYTRTTFEITSGALGAQDTLIGGGRYDGLAEALGGPPTKGFGFALGLERILLVLQESGKQAQLSSPQLFLAPLGEAAFEKATLLARDLRQQGIRCVLDFETRSLKSAMRLANKIQADQVLIVGDDELLVDTYVVKSLRLGHQMKVGADQLLRSGKKLEEMIAFDAFHRALPDFAGRSITWQLGDDPPDIVCSDSAGKRIGVELAEWLNEGQTRDSKRQRRMEVSFLTTIKSELQARPADIGKVELSPKQDVLLSTTDAAAFRQQLFALVTEIASSWNTFRNRRSPQGFPVADFSGYPSLGRYLKSLQVFGSEYSSTPTDHPWILFEPPGGAYSRESAIDALRRVIDKKTKMYADLREKHALDEVYLVIYYDSALLHNSPFSEVGFGFREVARSSARLVQNQHGVFQKIFLFNAINQDKEAIQIWPVQSDLLGSGQSELFSRISDT